MRLVDDLEVMAANKVDGVPLRRHVLSAHDPLAKAAHMGAFCVHSERRFA